MQQLHLVGFTTEHDALIFSARKGAKSGGFIVALDNALLDTIDEAERQRDGDSGGKRTRRSAPRPESALSPRDIQMRLRAGRSIANVASEAGVDEEWVMRFAVPILAEQALVIAKAQDMTFAKARLGDSGRTLKESVWWNVADKGVLMSEDMFDQCWTAQHLRDSSWVVRFDFVNRKKRQRAEWEVDTRDIALSARNRLASELGYVEPGRRGRPPAPLPAPAKPVVRPAPAARGVAKLTAAKKSPLKKKSPTKKKSPAKKVAKRSVAKKAPARRTVAKKATKRAPVKRAAVKRPTLKRTAKRAPAKRTPARRVAAKRPAPRRPAAKRAPAKKKAIARRSAPTRATPKRTAAAAKRAAPKRAPAKRPAAKRAPRPQPVEAPTPSTFETPMFDGGEATRPVTIRAPRAVEVDDPAPLPPPPVLTSTPQAGPAAATSADRRFGRLRRRRPPGT